MKDNIKIDLKKGVEGCVLYVYSLDGAPMTGCSEHINIRSCIFWDIALCSTLKVDRRFGGTSQAINQRERDNKQGIALISCLVYSSTLKNEVKYTSETSVDFQRNIWSFIQEDGTLHE
jgi:hypothetical protein